MKKIILFFLVIGCHSEKPAEYNPPSAQESQAREEKMRRDICETFLTQECLMRYPDLNDQYIRQLEAYSKVIEAAKK